MTPPDKAAIRAEAMRVLALFCAEGVEVVEADILQPAGTLLDLYGEDIRARAFTISDAGAGSGADDGAERMLRPDFTVPVALMHLAQRDGGPRRYAYAGEVFRRQPGGSDRPAEFLQVGLEAFDGGDPAVEEARVFAAIARVLAPLRLRVATGDIGILIAAVHGLPVGPVRRAALLRHLWRPRRFRALLDRFAGDAPMPPARAALLAAVDPLSGAGPAIGLRSRAEVRARLAALRADAGEPRVPAAAVALVDAILSLRAPAPDALVRLRDIAGDLPAIGAAVDAMAARLRALEGEGIDTATLTFEGSYGRTSMEYYDGFVFGFSATDRPELPAVATGGRYDALTARLDPGGAPTCAVGGVVRPGLMLALMSPVAGDG